MHTSDSAVSTRTGVRSTLRTAVITAALVATVAAARQNPPASPAPQTPVFTSGVDLVQLDVSVLDKDRQPVRGLTQADFSILEDGKPQTIAAFSAVDLPDVVTPASTWMRDVSPDVTTNEIDNRRIFAFVLDDAASTSDLWARRAVRESAVKIISHLGPDDLATVVFTGDTRNSQGLTNDRTRLIKAVESYSSAPFAIPCAGYHRSDAIALVTEYLAEAGLPDRRKTLILLSSDVAPPRICDSGVCPDACARMLDAVRSAQRANINFYPLDICGLRAPGLPGLPTTCGTGGAVDDLMVVANYTGGKAIVNTNDFDPGIQQMLVENSSYYLLGYRPANVKADGTIRRLEVKVSRPGVEVRTRHNYVAPKPPPKPGEKTPAPASPAIEALMSLLPKRDLPLRLALAPFAVPGTQTAAVAVALGVKRPALSERLTEEATLLVRAFTPEGDARGSADQPITLNLLPARRGSELSRFDLLARMDLKPGRYELRISAHSATLDKLGSVYADVEVPDFAKEPLSLSGVLLSVTPGVPAAPAEALSGIVPVLPTTEREFLRVERVSSFLRVYEGGKTPLAPVTLTTRIVDSQDKTVVDQTDTLGADRFKTARCADETFALPLVRLAPGEYLLTFEATMGKVTARRDVRFKVK